MFCSGQYRDNNFKIEVEFYFGISIYIYLWFFFSVSFIFLWSIEIRKLKTLLKPSMYLSGFKFVLTNTNPLLYKNYIFAIFVIKKKLQTI